MALKSKDFGALPADLARAARAQKLVADRRAAAGEPLTKEQQLRRAPRLDPKDGKVRRSRSWSEIWKRWFDSDLERRYADEALWPRFKAGEISMPSFQVHVQLIPRMPDGGGVAVRVDFAYVDHRRGEYIFDEFKGWEKPEWKIKRNIWGQVGPGRLLVHKWRRRDGFYCAEDIWPKHPGKSIADALAEQLENQP